MKALVCTAVLTLVFSLALSAEAYGPIEAIRNGRNRKECNSNTGFVVYAQIDNGAGWIVGNTTIRKGKVKKEERIAVTQIYGRGFHPVRYEKYMRPPGPITRDWTPEYFWSQPLIEMFYSYLNESATRDPHIFYQCHFPPEILYAHPQFPPFPR